MTKAFLLRSCAAFVVPAIFATVVPTAAYAQETTAEVTGRVLSGGQPVADATVTIVHVPSGTTSTVNSDAGGAFGASGLRIGGPVTITVSAPGFDDATITDLNLTAGEPLRVNVTLEKSAPATSGQEVVVTGSRAVARDQSDGPITALTRTQIEGVASVNRDIRDLARRDPFVTLDPTNSRTVEVAGNNGRLNRFSVDGAQFSDDFGLNNGGLPTSRGPVPYDAIEQFSVKVAPYDVSEGDFQGGAINVILRSGGNRFRGSGFFSYSDDSLTGDKTRGIPVDLKFDSKQFGGVLSGPIIKDKLFFMVGFEGTNESDPFDDGVGPGFANQVPGVTQAQIDEVTEIARDVYGYDTQGLIQNAVEKDRKYVAKLDWNIMEGQRASFTFIRNVGTQQFQQNTFTTPPYALGLQSNGYELKENVNSGVFQLNSTWTDAFSTEFRASLREYKRDQTPFGGRDFAQFEVCLDPTSINSGSNSRTSCGGTRLFFGPDISRQTNDLDTKNLSIDLTGRYQAGAHTFKAIAGYTKVDTYNLFIQRSLGDIYFDSIADFEAQRANRFRLGGAVPSLDPDDAAAEFASQTYTFGVQDDWQVTDDFQLTAGVRWDFFGSNDQPPLNVNFLARQGFANTATFDEKDLLQPRIGFNWTPTRRLVIRGGTGIFGGGTPDVFVSNSFSNTGTLTNAIDISRDGSAKGCNRTVGATAADQLAFCNAALNGITGANFPTAVTDYLATNVGSLALAPVNAIDPDLDIASQWRSSLSVNYEANLGSFLGDGWLFGADLLYSKVQDAYLVSDFRSTPIGTLPDGRPRYGALVPGDTSNNQDLVLTNTSKGRSLIAVARFNKRFDFGLTIDGSYTRSDVKDVSALTSATAGSLFGNNAFSDPGTTAYGRSIYEIRDQWKFGADFRRKFFGNATTRISLFGEYRSGRPYSITGLDRSSGRLATYGSVGNGGRVLLYIPQAGNDPRVVFDTPASEAAFNTLVSELNLGKYRGKVVPKNSQTSPDFFKVDLHLAQEVPAPFISTGKFEFFADVENLLNLIDSDWGSLRQVAFPYTAAIVDVQCATFNGPSCTQYRYSRVTAPNEVLNSRQSLYQIRVGARFSF